VRAAIKNSTFADICAAADDRLLNCVTRTPDTYFTLSYLPAVMNVTTSDVAPTTTYSSQSGQPHWMIATFLWEHCIKTWTIVMPALNI